VAAWWERIRWRPVLAYAAPGAPAAILGAHTLLTISPKSGRRILRRVLPRDDPSSPDGSRAGLARPLWHLGLAGAVVWFLTGLVLSTGPLSVPMFTRYGLSGGGFLGFEAASALLLYAAKLATFGQAGALTSSVVTRGPVIGIALMAGPFFVRGTVRRLNPRRYASLIDVVLVAATAGMFIALVAR